jgi:iron complex outermembrane receptor protein
MNQQIDYKYIMTLFLCAIPAITVQAGNKIPTSDQQSLEEPEIIEDIELLDMEIPTVVTATRREQKITTIPHAISVITAQDIRLAGARSIPDALRLVPGMDVAQLSYSNAAVGARGLHG